MSKLSRTTLKVGRAFIAGLLVAGIVSVASRYGVTLMLSLIDSVSVWSIAYVLIYAIVLSMFALSVLYFYRQSVHGTRFAFKFSLALGELLMLLGALLIIWAIPSLIIYWFINPQHLKRAIQIAVFLLSLGILFF